MEHVESVEEIDSKRSHWVVRGPLGRQLHWDARIVNESHGEMIGWESLPGAEVITQAQSGSSRMARAAL